jgi:hypothetical protein
MSVQNDSRVVVVDIKMPFMSMVIFMVKWAIAAIPAFIILSVIGAVIMTILHGMMGPPGGPMVRL